MTRRLRTRVPGLLAALLCTAAAAQQPAVDTSPGTTIVGEQEAAVGLYITPWQEEAPGDLDRPPALFKEPLDSVDPAAFGERTASQETLADYRRSALDRRR